MADAADLISVGLAAAGVALLAVNMVRHLRRVRDDAAKADARRKYEQETFHSMEGLLTEIQGLVVESTRRAEDKMLALERLLKQAEDRTQRMQALAAELDAKPAVQTGPVALRVVPGEAGPRAAQQRQVFLLADQGRRPPEIAQEVGITTGEVELILALREKRRALG